MCIGIQILGSHPYRGGIAGLFLKKIGKLLPCSIF
jgi:hypothetical protein